MVVAVLERGAAAGVYEAALVSEALGWNATALQLYLSAADLKINDALFNLGYCYHTIRLRHTPINSDFQILIALCVFGTLV